eukprot:CAMPEP_0172203674 /NCGR_PEP_ID=MMETSP1050-20130122/31431_1 /TAXON_ID=233186 /ORGANISM="Cryptomonas curvata, Strain CCAP979/52" /LENGTH=103 /DNA_ID=CAMNT_0012881947 /DNA_START=254 /DNA_END=562 /DNA_ORIENTATION=+
MCACQDPFGRIVTLLLSPADMFADLRLFSELKTSMLETAVTPPYATWGIIQCHVDQVRCPGIPHDPITAHDYDADMAARGINTGTTYTYYDGQTDPWADNSGW